MNKKPLNKSVGNADKKQSVSGTDGTEDWCTVYKNRWGQNMAIRLGTSQSEKDRLKYLPWYTDRHSR